MRNIGKNRRIHTCFITENREYHVRANECVAVRDRKSSIWIAGHKAIGMHLKPQPPGAPYLGKKLEFLSPGKDKVLHTSAVVDILRPNKNEVNSYRLVQGFKPQEKLTG